MSCPKCHGICHCEPARAGKQHAAGALKSGLFEPACSGPEPWRQEVAKRVHRYRARRRRGDRCQSLALDFETSPASLALLAAEQESPGLRISEDAGQQFYGGSAHPAETRTAESNLINFPKPPDLRIAPVEELENRNVETSAGQLTASPEDPAEAGAQDERPAPDLVTDAAPSIPCYPTIVLDAVQEPEAEEREHLGLLLPVAPISLRAVAAITDSAPVLLAGWVSCSILARLRAVPETRTALEWALLAGLSILLWLVYQYLFLVYNGATPGLKLAKLALVTFEGKRVALPQRRLRALAGILSCLPMGLGFVWAWFDEEALCWHDRISRTVLIFKTTRKIHPDLR